MRPRSGERLIDNFHERLNADLGTMDKVFCHSEKEHVHISKNANLCGEML